jgi:hypothetical protein
MARNPKPAPLGLSPSGGPRPAKAGTPNPTTAQSLGALLKSARDIMRKGKGLNSDLDRLPMLTWIMFLKFLNALELQREGKAKLAGKKFKPTIEPPYRWRDWAAKSDGELQFTLPGVLKVSPISQHGNVPEIIGKFGGADQPGNAVNQLQTRLYAA